MKVLHVIPAVAPRYGGPSQAVVEMCLALQEQGIDVQIATTDADGENHLKVELGRVFNHRGVPAIFFHRNFNEPFGYSSTLASWLRQEVRNFDVVHVHAVFSHPCIAAAKACRKAGVPYIVRPLGSLDPWSLRRRHFAKKMLWAAGVRSMLKGAAAIHYTTAAESKLAEPLNFGKSVVIPLGVSVEEYQRELSPGREQGWKPYVLILSRLHPKKGLDVFIPAFLEAIIESRLENWNLVLAGEGNPDYVDRLRALTRNHKNVIFAGWLEGEDKIRALQNASVLALPSRGENFGLCLIESLACGKPVIVTPEVNLSDLVAQRNLGLVVPLEMNSMKKALLSHIDGNAHRQFDRAEASAVVAEFSWKSIAQKLSSLYLALCKPAAEIC